MTGVAAATDCPARPPSGTQAAQSSATRSSACAPRVDGLAGGGVVRFRFMRLGRIIFPSIVQNVSLADAGSWRERRSLWHRTVMRPARFHHEDTGGAVEGEFHGPTHPAPRGEIDGYPSPRRRMKPLFCASPPPPVFGAAGGAVVGALVGAAVGAAAGGG